MLLCISTSPRYGVMGRSDAQNIFELDGICIGKRLLA